MYPLPSRPTRVPVMIHTHPCRDRTGQPIVRLALIVRHLLPRIPLATAQARLRDLRAHAFYRANILCLVVGAFHALLWFGRSALAVYPPRLLWLGPLRTVDNVLLHQSLQRPPVARYIRLAQLVVFGHISGEGVV